jgi:hypothetical protein
MGVTEPNSRNDDQRTLRVTSMEQREVQYVRTVRTTPRIKIKS